MSRTIKQIAFSPSNIVNSAIMLFKSKGYISILVEGKKDETLLKSIFSDKKVKFPICNGKPRVIESLEYLNRTHKNMQGVYFLVDVDFDFILNNIINDDKLIYSFFCKIEDKLYFNDIESFIVFNNEFNAINKLILNLGEKYDFDSEEIKNKLELFSRKLGAYRAADEKLKNDKSILDGVDLFEFASFSKTEGWDWEMIFNENELKTRLENSSPRKLDIDELFNEAQLLYESCKYGELSQGHDLCRILKKFLIENTKGHLLKKHWETADDVEAMLRMCIDANSFLKTNVGKNIISILPSS